MTTSDAPCAVADRLPVRPDLAAVEPYGAPQLDVPVRLNTNETAEPPPPGFLPAVAERIVSLELNRYPDRPHRALREALAARLGLDAEQVWAANGSNEILLQLLQAYGGPERRVAYVRPGYSMYPELCRTALTPAVEVDLDDDFALTADVVTTIAATDPDLVLVPSPNNPVGTPVGRDAVRQLHARTRALVVVDEAYVEFGDADASVLPLLDELTRLVVVRTFSKAFRLAGLRLGYLAAADWVVQDVQKVRLPYHLDAVKQVTGLVALEQEEAFLGHRQRVADERDRVAAALRQLPGVQVWPSAANFLLLRTGVDDLFARLLERGVLVRDFSRRPRLVGCVRVTIGTADENDAFLTALRDVLA
ncbi:histidinol-phosphate transaminase [Egicoccus halophilus]|uniref:Histidinol-phosphate aminotransferase n=1 Tax=Egicoccus halophilus TaxID=1670830 RepID=A0A8J3A881_9ACTN|nr:histidinol-phosphate transaminase [Egicoccus halophilus]GGI04369.1 histidinol-phosphate aminotransferase [Egicoccus halophilus]